MSIIVNSHSSGFSYVGFNNSDCSDISVGNNFMFPRDFNTSADGKMIPSVIIDNASIVVNITNAVNAKSTNFTISQCDTTSVTFNTGFLTAITPTVGKLIVIQGQCVTVMPEWKFSEECLPQQVDFEAALIGDFCKRSPSAKVCEGHNPKATLPPTGVSPTTSNNGSTEGADEKKAGVTPAPSSAESVARTSTRRVLLSLVMASLAIGFGTS